MVLPTPPAIPPTWIPGEVVSCTKESLVIWLRLREALKPISKLVVALSTNTRFTEASIPLLVIEPTLVKTRLEKLVPAGMGTTPKRSKVFLR